MAPYRRVPALVPLVSLALATSLAGALLLGLAAKPAGAATGELFFSEYVEGSSTNKALEVFNGTADVVALDGVYDVQIFANGSATATATIGLQGTIAAGDAFVLARSGAAAELVSRADQTTSNFLFNGNDAVVLRNNGAIVDVIGQIGTDPGTAWSAGGVTTADGTMRRKATVTEGDPDGADVFDPAAEWDGLPLDTFDGLGVHTIEADPGNTAPAAADDLLEADTAPVRIDALANDVDADGDTISIVSIGTPTAGAAEIVEGGDAISFTPPASEWTRAVLDYTISDPAGATDSATIEIIFVGQPEPEPRACGLPATIEGTDAPDVLFGTPGDDVIHAGAGNDLVFGLGGNDVICGGAGVDILFGNAGDDVIVDEAGRTLVVGGAGDDTIETGAASDSVWAGPGADDVSTGDGADRVRGGPGDDTIDAGSGADFVNGGRGQDTCAVEPVDRVRECP